MTEETLGFLGLMRRAGALALGVPLDRAAEKLGRAMDN